MIGYDIDPQLTEVPSLRELADRLGRPRQVWIMVPHGPPTDEAIEAPASPAGRTTHRQ